MKKQLFFVALAACFYSCSDSPMAYEPIKNGHSRSELQLSLKQATAYANVVVMVGFAPTIIFGFLLMPLIKVFGIRFQCIQFS